MKKTKKVKKPKHDCFKCTHHRTIPGDAHFRCNNPKAKVELNPTGVRGGWAAWPINFCPVWIDSCDGFSDNPKNLTKPDVKLSEGQQLLAILRIFGG